MSSNKGSQMESANWAVADEQCDHASMASLCASLTLSPNCEEPANGKSGRGDPGRGVLVGVHR